jgi:uncharacterized protein with HEPN domain
VKPSFGRAVWFMPRDILHHIELAQTFVAGFDGAAFRDDLRTVFAVIRCLEIVSEASRTKCTNNWYYRVIEMI